jgi:predicted metal-dependent phosphoesterase TrpH
MALTDHSNWHTSKGLLETYADVPTGIKLFLGEEVHLGTIIHIVSFNANRSITDLYRANTDEIRAQLKEESTKLETPWGVDPYEYAYRKWICEQIRAAGGMCIVPHPYWVHKPHIFNMNSRMLGYVFETGIYDAFELTGGQKVEENNYQINFYHDMRAKGFDIPICGSSDSHGTDQSVYFGISKTVLFAKDTSYEGIREAILGHYSVAVEEEYGEQIRIHGHYRMVKYARFLIDYYFPGHDELCVEQGILMREYALGETSAADALRTLDGSVERYMQKTLRGE